MTTLKKTQIIRHSLGIIVWLIIAWLIIAWLILFSYTILMDVLTISVQMLFSA